MNIEITNIKGIKNLYHGRLDSTFIQLFRYTFVGGFAFIVDFSCLYLLTEFLHLHYLISAAIAFLFGLTVNYILSVLWVFNDRALSNKFVEFIVFALIGVVGLGLNELFLWYLTDIAGIYYLLSKIITAFIVYFWNFFARKIILFNKGIDG
jgi:putative flippase GtrA